jgi:hypothetical protein
LGLTLPGSVEGWQVERWPGKLQRKETVCLDWQGEKEETTKLGGGRTGWPGVRIPYVLTLGPYTLSFRARDRKKNRKEKKKARGEWEGEGEGKRSEKEKEKLE